MSHPWFSKLPAGARIGDGRIEDFGNAVAERQAAVSGSIRAPLPEYGVIAASGADAADFLHNQLSNDIKGLAVGEFRLAAYCTPKGRMLGLLRVLRRQDGFLLLLPTALIPSLLKRLRMFVLRSKVTLEDLSETLLVQGLAGVAVSEALAARYPALPEPGQAIEAADSLLLRLPGAHPRFLLLAEAEPMASIDEQLPALTPAGGPAWQLLQIEAGEPEVLPGGQEQWVPQMANLDLLDGISFTKGCYPGQEIVARMHYLGNLKRRLFRVRFADGELPAPGTELRDGEDKLAGEIVMAAPAPEGLVGLAVLQIERAEAGGLQLDGRQVTAEALAQ